MDLPDLELPSLDLPGGENSDVMESDAGLDLPADDVTAVPEAVKPETPADEAEAVVEETVPETGAESAAESTTEDAGDK